MILTSSGYVHCADRNRCFYVLGITIQVFAHKDGSHFHVPYTAYIYTVCIRSGSPHRLLLWMSLLIEDHLSALLRPIIELYLPYRYKQINEAARNFRLNRLLEARSMLPFTHKNPHTNFEALKRLEIWHVNSLYLSICLCNFS